MVANLVSFVPSGNRKGVMLAHAFSSTAARSLTRRCIVRAESRPDEAVDDPREAVAKVPALIKRRRSHGGGRLKKSKRMQALAASLASKTRGGQSTEAASSQLPERLERSIDESDCQLTEAAMNSETAVHIPYDPRTELGGQFENDPEDHCVLPKPIYIISDCTGNRHSRQCQ